MGLRNASGTSTVRGCAMICYEEAWHRRTWNGTCTECCRNFEECRLEASSAYASASSRARARSAGDDSSSASWASESFKQTRIMRIELLIAQTCPCLQMPSSAFLTNRPSAPATSVLDEVQGAAAEEIRGVRDWEGKAPPLNFVA